MRRESSHRFRDGLDMSWRSSQQRRRYSAIHWRQIRAGPRTSFRASHQTAKCVGKTRVRVQLMWIGARCESSSTYGRICFAPSAQLMPTLSKSCARRKSKRFDGLSGKGTAAPVRDRTGHHDRYAMRDASKYSSMANSAAFAFSVSRQSRPGGCQLRPHQRAPVRSRPRAAYRG